MLKKKFIPFWLGLLIFSFEGFLWAKPLLQLVNFEAKKDFPHVKVEVVLNNKKGLKLEDFTENNFSIYEDGSLVNHTQLKAEEGSDFFSFIFSIDSSRSLSGEELKDLKRIAKQLVDNFGVKDRVALSNFDDRVYISNRFFQNDKKNLKKKINSMVRQGLKTLFFDALYDGLDYLEEFQSSKKAIFVFTDGKDEGSSLNEDDVIILAKKLGVPIYFITFQRSAYLTKQKRMARLTGGEVFFVQDLKKGIDSYVKLLQISQKKYTFWYKSKLEPDNQPHRIEIKFKSKNYNNSIFTTFTIKPDFDLVEYLYQKRDFIFVFFMGLLFLSYLASLYLLRKERALRNFKYQKHFEEMATEDSSEKEDFFYNQFLENELEQSKELLFPKETRGVKKSLPEAWLICKNGLDIGKEIIIKSDKTYLEQDFKSQVAFSENDIYSKEAMIKFIKDEFYLFDLVSAQGIFLNNRKLLRPRKLCNGDLIQIGQKKYIFRRKKNNV